MSTPDLVYDDSRTRRSREDLLNSGLFAARAPEPGVPDVIIRSWRRCLSESVPQTRAVIPYLDTVDRQAQLVEAARPVMQRVAENLGGIEVALFLSDNKGQIMLRRVNDNGQCNVFDNASAAEGFDFSENTIGTNGLGTVIEERHPVFVRGSEHYNEALERLACAGVPIFKPYTRRVLGSFALACRSDAANALMYAMALDVGRQIETNLANMEGDRERALAQAYLTAKQSSREPVIVISEHTALANTLGLQYLSNEFHALLWADLRGRQAPDAPARITVPVEDGHRKAIVERVAGADEDATYLIRLLPAAREQPAHRTKRSLPTAQRHSPVALSRSSADATASQVHPVERVHEQIATATRLRECVVIDGYSGTGKLTVAQAALSQFHQVEHPLIIDLSLELQGGGRWYRIATKALDAGRGVILMHLQDLPSPQVNLVKAIAQRTHSQPSTRPTATPAAPMCPLVMTVNLADSPEQVTSLVTQIATVIELPQLQTMTAQIPHLVRRMLADMPPGQRPACFSTGALQALMRWDWPGNLAELRRTVEQIAKRLPGQSVDVGHLPAQFQTAGQRRQLSIMESAERDAIIAALHQCGGRKSEAAAALGIGRTTLYRKIRLHRIPIT